MRAKKLAVLFFVLLNSFVAQQKENYFPHAVGNAWQYTYNDGRIFKEVIIRDSLLEDSSKLLLSLSTLQKKSNSDRIWSYRVSKNQDSIIQWPNEINILLYKFPMKPGDRWMLWDSVSQSGYMGHCWGEFQTTFFDIAKKGYIIDYYNKYEIDDTATTFYTWAWREHVVDGFGKTLHQDEVEYYSLTGCIIDGIKYGTITEINNNIHINNIDEYILYQNYPNPFNINTQISFYLKNPDYVQLLIYNSLGEIVKVLQKEFTSAGVHKVNFDASNYPSGIYYYRFILKNSSTTKKMIYLK